MFKYAICNETFQDWPFEKAFAFARECGYTGIEIAPFTLAQYATEVSSQQRAQVRKQAEAAGLEVVGLHWLLAKTEGFYLTSPDPAVRSRTSGYLTLLAHLCRDLGGSIMVLGSPKQRNLLPGVTSNRVDVRQAAARAERVVEQEAEPLWAAFAPAGLWPGRALDVAWKAMVRNAAHDSVCACSHDEVVDAVHHRYAEARQIGDALRAQGLRLVGAALAGDEQVAVNTLPRTRGGLVRLTRPGHRPEPGEQLLAATPPLTLPRQPPVVEVCGVADDLVVAPAELLNAAVVARRHQPGIRSWMASDRSGAAAILM
jgi:sugar phosphate isomerase/epimerase